MPTIAPRSARFPGRLALAVLFPVVSALVLVLAPAPAHAAVGDFTCTASAYDSYAPGIQTTPILQHETFAVSYSACQSSSQPSITSGTTSSNAVAVRRCLNTAPTDSATSTITWNTGRTSTFAGTITASYVANQTVLTWQGTVTSGVFTGAGFTETISQNNFSPLACATPPGVTSQSGTGTLVSS